MRQNLTSIVAIDRNGAIGCKNRLPWTIKSDMAFFRRTTMDNNVIMGRKTYESIGGCLKGRRNLVLSHNRKLLSSTDTCKLVNSLEEAMAYILRASEKETFVIGGAATYQEFSKFVDRYLVTIVEHTSHDADSFLSEEIRTEFGDWPSIEIAAFPADPGRDQFSFRIIEYSAPDAEERRELRKALAHQFITKDQRLPNSKRSNRQSSAVRDQAAFLF